MLLLLPNLLDETTSVAQLLPASVGEAVRTIQGLIAESEKGGRAYLKLFGVAPQKMPIRVLSEHTTKEELDELLSLLKKGERWGLVSDCGLPCLADPGADLVLRARQMNLPIQAFVGPSSITLALMLSGLSGQKFTFHGYLEREEEKLSRQIRALEKLSAQEKETQLCIEAPYRSPKLLGQLLQHLSDKTLLSVAWDLTLPTETVITQPVSVWKKKPLPDLTKKPAIFLFFSN
ncbi:MAG: SAM-dependent methyltransferase [Chlamydiales bacterium]|nr:SAM-dependent methyltransferase [Chlamydiales bacterium]